MATQQPRVVIVTGSATGIGAATVHRLASAGYVTVAADRSAEVEKHESLADVHAFVADLTDESANAKLVEFALGYGPLVGLVINAGIGGVGSLEDFPMEEFDQIMTINVRAGVLALRSAASALRSSGGAVSVTCSIEGLFGNPKMWAYCTSKGALINFVRSAALELAGSGVRVNGVCPGPIARTGSTIPFEANAPEQFEAIRQRVPLKRWGLPDEIAGVHQFLLSSDASFMTGSLVVVDGGTTIGTGTFSADDPW